MTRAARLFLGLALGFVVLAGEARAERLVVVLDRGRAAEEGAADHERVALALLAAHEQDEEPPQLIVYGTRPGGRSRSGVLTRGFEKTLDSSRRAAGWSYDGPTDIRKALDLARSRAREGEALHAVLVGPFGGAALDAGEGEAYVRAWNDEASPARRVVPLFASAEARARLAGVEGVVERGWLVLGHGEPRIETSPYAPLEEDGRLEARVFVPLDQIAVGAADGILPLEVATDRESDLLDVDAREDGVHVHLRRGERDRTNATLTFRWPERPEVLPLPPPPPPSSFAWEERVPGARWETEPGEGSAPRFDALDVVGASDPLTLSLLVADAATPSHWEIVDAAGAFPAGLRAQVAEGDAGRPHVRRQTITLRFAYPGQPVDAKGELIVRAAGRDETFRIPYRVRTAPCRVHVRPDDGAHSAKLPLAEDDPDFAWLVEHLGGNRARRVRLRVDVHDDRLAQGLVLRTRAGDEEVTLGHGDVLDIDTATLPLGIRVRPELPGPPAGAGAGPVDGAFGFTLLEEDGVVGTADGAGRLEARRPRLVLESSRGAYVMKDDVVTAPRPWILRVDPDGGPATWRRALAAVPPRLDVPPTSPSAWRLDPVDEGAWSLVPEGAWRGARAGTFEGRTETLPLRVTWEAGPSPGEILVDVVVRPRWGRAGWILVGLAAIALVIGGIAVSHLRSPPVVGTLLYAVEGKEGAVGRLDLGPVGRGARSLTVDAGGRLELGGKGRRVGRVRATRVGGMLALEPDDGPRTQHLLVDGLAVETGGHRLRFVSGNPDESRIVLAPEPVPDLLGPEFDLEGGRIRALTPRSPVTKDPSGIDGEAETQNERSQPTK